MLNTIRARKFLSGPFLFILSFVFSPVAVSKTLVFQQDEPSETPAGVKSYSTASVGNTSANSELFFMLDQLQQEVRMLRGLVEEQAYQIQLLQQSGKSRYKDLDGRILNLSKQFGAIKDASAAVVPVVPQGKKIDAGVDSSTSSLDEAISTAAPTLEQKKAYQSAYAFIKEKQFEQAIDAMHQFIDKYPEGELAGNAYYWLGEVYLVLPQLEQARQAFTIVIKSFPNHRKVADALFKLGVTYDRMQDPAQSEQYLNQVQASYPESTAAKLAKSYKINR